MAPSTKPQPHVSSVELMAHKDQDTIVVTEYGIEYPDGTIDWTLTRPGGGRGELSIQAIATNRGYDRSYWEGVMKSKAEAASMDVEEYTNSHHFLKRTVIVAVTAAETVEVTK